MKISRPLIFWMIATATASPAAHASSQGTVRYHNGKLVEDSTPPVIAISSEFDNYKHGKLAVPAYPGDMVYMGATVQTEGGSPLKNVEVHIESKKGNPSVLITDRTDKSGYLEFRMLANRLGEDTVTVSAAGIKSDFLMEVTEPPRDEWLGKFNLKSVTSWDLLMSADVSIGRNDVSAKFPFALQALANQKIRLVGFMLPLGINEKQTHFLLSANPPSCFFHPPGGPSSAVEVFAGKAVEMSDDPMIVEGTFELIERNEGGILYKLHDARLVAKGS